MSIVFVSEELIEKPVSVVWQTLTNWDLAPKWMNGIGELSANGATETGTVLTFNARGKDRTTLIENCEPEKVIVLKSVQGSVTARYKYELSSTEENKTKVRLTAECGSDGFLMKFLFPVLKVAIKKSDGSQISNLKSLIESD